MELETPETGVTARQGENTGKDDEAFEPQFIIVRRTTP